MIGTLSSRLLAALLLGCWLPDWALGFGIFSPESPLANETEAAAEAVRRPLRDVGRGRLPAAVEPRR